MQGAWIEMTLEFLAHNDDNDVAPRAGSVD